LNRHNAMTVTEREARVLAKNFAIAQYKVPERNITLLSTTPVVNALLCKSSYSIELEITTGNDTEERHQVAVDMMNGEVILIY